MDQNPKGIQVSLIDGSVGFAVQPKYDCPHYNFDNLQNVVKYGEENDEQLFVSPCKICKDTKENWICLTCTEIHCARSINEHMIQHNSQTDHPIVLSLSDLSFWCYKCDSYITNDALQKASRVFSSIKFKKNSNDDDNNQIKELIESFTNLKVVDETEFTQNKLIDGLLNKKYKKICILAGAGLSVAAGIPDFRTPGTGLYSQLEKYKLPNPEAVFDINYFKKNPEAFYCIAREFLLTFDAKPTIAHKFIKWLDDRQQLLCCFTQNIDGLELDVGIKEENVVQAHGHMRKARCINCKEEVNIKEFKDHIKDGKVHNCDKCKDGLIKPDVVFFGENLPVEFFQKWGLLKQADLVIIVGTSLLVMPFAASVNMVKKEVPILVLNRDNVVKGRKNTLFLGGDIEENCIKLLDQLK